MPMKSVKREYHSGEKRVESYYYKFSEGDASVPLFQAVFIIDALRQPHVYSLTECILTVTKLVTG